MAKTLFVAVQILWAVCALVPAVVLIVLKRKKQASVRIFFKGAVLSLALHLMLYAAFGWAVGFNETDLTMAVVPITTALIGFVLFCCVYRNSDTPEQALSRALGVAQIVLLFWAFIIVCGIEFMWSDRHYMPTTNTELIETGISFLILALVQTAIAFFGTFGTYKIYSSEKLSGRRKVLLSSLFATLMCFAVFIFGYTKQLIV